MKHLQFGLRAAEASLLLLLVVGHPTEATAQGPIAVIVHPSNPMTTISPEELRRLYLGTRTTMPNREPVILLDNPESRDRFYHAALAMNSDRVKRHWIAAVLSGESSSPPKEIRGSTEIIQYVASHRGAIAFLGTEAVTGPVKLIAIGGLRPNDPGYLLQ